MWPVLKLPIKGFIVTTITFNALFWLLGLASELVTRPDDPEIWGWGPLIAGLYFIGLPLISLVIFIISIILGIIKQSDKTYSRKISSTDVRFFIYGSLIIIIFVWVYLAVYLTSAYK